MQLFHQTISYCFLCICMGALHTVCVYDICAWARVWPSCWHEVTSLTQKRAEIKQVEQQALFRSKFCMLVNVNLMNKQSKNQAFLMSSVCFEVCLDGGVVEWVIQPYFNHQWSFCS